MEYLINFSIHDPLVSAAPSFSFAVVSLKNAPSAPKKPSCLKNIAFVSPLLQKFTAKEIVFIVYAWPRIKYPPKNILCKPCALAFIVAKCAMLYEIILSKDKVISALL